MSKAVLVIDMPNDSGSCMFPVLCTDGLNCEPMIKDYENGLTEINPVIEDEDNKPYWCPLRLLPEKPDCMPLGKYSYVSGWNDCIDMITVGVDDGTV